MSTALACAAALSHSGLPASPDTIRAISWDGPHALCMTEPLLDTWWASLSAPEKGLVWELFLDDSTSGVLAELQYTMARLDHLTHAPLTHAPFTGATTHATR